MPTVQLPTLGDMRVKYTILQSSGVQDASGNLSAATSVVIPTIWGSMVDEIRPYFLLVASGITPKSRYTITVRYRPGITKNMIIQEISTGRQFHIQEINNLNHRNEWLSLTCTEFA